MLSSLFDLLSVDIFGAAGFEIACPGLMSIYHGVSQEVVFGWRKQMGSLLCGGSRLKLF
jgi:hypothetical protein